VNPWHLDATGLMAWGLVAHLIADWPLQNDWMARWKVVPQHPAAIVHAGIHAILLAVVFGWPAAFLALAHMAIDTRAPVVWWSKLVRQTQPTADRAMLEGKWTTTGMLTLTPRPDEPGQWDQTGDTHTRGPTAPLYDIGTEVRIWTDQTFHLACIAIAALLVVA
jgi:hypothetical protein